MEEPDEKIIRTYVVIVTLVVCGFSTFMTTLHTDEINFEVFYKNLEAMSRNQFQKCQSPEDDFYSDEISYTFPNQSLPCHNFGEECYDYLKIDSNRSSYPIDINSVAMLAASSSEALPWETNLHLKSGKVTFGVLVSDTKEFYFDDSGPYLVQKSKTGFTREKQPICLSNDNVDEYEYCFGSLTLIRNPEISEKDNKTFTDRNFYENKDGKFIRLLLPVDLSYEIPIIPYRTKWQNFVTASIGIDFDVSYDKDIHKRRQEKEDFEVGGTSFYANPKFKRGSDWKNQIDAICRPDSAIYREILKWGLKILL